jgi:hypothetical protein
LVIVAPLAFQETVNRCPVGLAEIAERGAGFRRFPLAPGSTIVQRVVWNTVFAWKDAGRVSFMEM